MSCEADHPKLGTQRLSPELYPAGRGSVISHHTVLIRDVNPSNPAMTPTPTTELTPNVEMMMDKSNSKLPPYPSCTYTTPFQCLLLQLPLLLRLPTHQILQERRHRHRRQQVHLGRRRVFLAVNLVLGLTRAPLVLGHVGEDGGQVGAAAAPGLLGWAGG